METQLTLTVESQLAQSVESYAQRQGFTLSELVENYFLSLVKSEEKKEKLNTAPIASALLGCLKAPDKMDYKEEMTDYLINKYL